MSRSQNSSAAQELNEILGGVRSLIDTLQSAVDDDRTVERTVQFGTPGGEIDGVVGVRVQTGIAGASVRARETVGPIRAGEETETARRPAVDVHDDGDRIRLVVEMPGIGAEDLAFTVEGDRLLLSAETDRRRYRREVSLPRPVDAENASVAAEAGLVEIVLPVAGPDA